MRNLRAHHKTIWWVVALVLLTSVWVFFAHEFSDTRTFGGSDDGTAVKVAFEQQRSGVWVNVSGKVTRLLPDDNKGARHQRFILRLESGHTVMIAHNIDLVIRVPLVIGDMVELRGRYEWNHKGGVVHWTHHDPDKKMEGGWIDHKSQRYR
ncbi:MAG: DUF3465 domain-containing protein [Gammaproteobacteria bacterium]|nr:DUF3465 domain-containing protein [Gammaproteobacteria bacterium]